MKAVVVGATGLVGEALLAELARQGIPAAAIARRPGPAQLGIQWRVADLARLTAKDIPDDATVALCALGTTIKAAGSQEAFRAVDHGLVLTFAKACHSAGIQTFVVVSAAGANAKSRVFYSLVKGEMERDLAGLGFASLTVLHPGLLLGERKESRPLERLAIQVTRALRPILPAAARGVEAAAVAHHMVLRAKAATPGIHVVSNGALRRPGG